MKLTLDQILKAAEISTLDADVRFSEFNRYHNIESGILKYDITEMKKIISEPTYFDIANVEGIFGMMGDSLFIMFRGSDSIKDWIRNFMFCKKVVPYNGTRKAIKVHQGFLKDYLAVRTFVQGIVKVSKVKKVFFFGHSLGAVLATFAALDIQYNYPDVDVGVCGLGSPKIGNAEFKKSIESRLPDLILIEHGSDAVPRILPPSIFGFKYLERQIHIGPEKKKGLGTMKDHDWHLYFDALKAELPVKL